MTGWGDDNKRYGYYEDDEEEWAPSTPHESGPVEDPTPGPEPEREDRSVLRFGPSQEPELMPEKSEAQAQAHEEVARQLLQEKIDFLVASGRAERIDIVAIRTARETKKKEED